MSSRVRASTGRSSTLRLTAGPRNCSISMTLDVFVGSDKNATGESLGIVSLSSFFQLFASQVRSKRSQTGDVTAWPRKPLHEPGRYRIRGANKNNRDSLDLFCGFYPSAPNYNIDSKPDHLISDSASTVRLTFCRSPLDGRYFFRQCSQAREGHLVGLSVVVMFASGTWLTRTNRGIFLICCASTTAPQITIPKAITENHNHFRKNKKKNFGLPILDYRKGTSKGMRSSVCSLGF